MVMGPHRSADPCAANVVQNRPRGLPSTLPKRTTDICAPAPSPATSGPLSPFRVILFPSKPSTLTGAAALSGGDIDEAARRRLLLPASRTVQAFRETLVCTAFCWVLLQ